MMEKELSDDEDELFQIKSKRKREDEDEEEEEKEAEEETRPPAKKCVELFVSSVSSSGMFRRSAKKTSNGGEFLSIVKKKFDRRKDRVKTLSVEDFE